MSKSPSRKIKRIVLVDYSCRPKQCAHIRKYRSGKIKRVNPGIKKRQRMSLGIPEREKVVPLKYPKERISQPISESEAESIKKNIELAKEFGMETHLTRGQKSYAKKMGWLDKDTDTSDEESDRAFSFERGRNKFRETSE